MNHRYLQLMRRKWSAIVLFAVFVLAANAVAADINTQSAYVPNRLLIKLAPGLTEAQRSEAFDKIGAKLVRPIALANTYLVELVPTRGETVNSAITRSRTVSQISYASPDYLAHVEATPNDDYWANLWNMRLINANDAWDITTGSAEVTVAVIDTGVSKTHPDLSGRLLNGMDVADNDNDVTPDEAAEVAGHGTHVAGIIGAQGNNGVGVVGVCWNNVKILPVKVFSKGQYYAATSDIIDGLDYAMQQNVQVVNMSFGVSEDSVAMHDKIKDLYANGIIIVASAGNDYGAAVTYPAAYSECIAVSAIGPDERIAAYSNYGAEIDIAAPGGADNSINTASGVWSTYWTSAEGNTYAGMYGTSMAAPHVAGAAALMISAGIPKSQVAGMIYRGARAPAVGVLDPIKYGHGVLDIYKAMHANAEINILEPEDAQSFDTTTPQIKISTYLVAKESIKVYLDFTDANSDGIPDDPSQGVVFNGNNIDSDPNVTWDADEESLTIRWPSAGQSPLSAGTHTICVTGDPVSGANGGTVSDWAVFFIKAHVLTAGRHLFSIPYPLTSDVTPTQLFGAGNFWLARYIPAISSYATINFQSSTDDEANAWPANPGVHPHGDTQDTPPAGLGFFVEIANNTSIAVSGTVDTTKDYDITLTRGSTGWNMIGNPFPFSVPWGSVKVTYRGVTLTMSDAVAKKWILPYIYRYTTSGYTFENTSEGVLVPWEGHWVKILPEAPMSVNDNDTMILTIPPIESSSIVETPKSRSALSNAGGWSVNLVAKVGDVVDSQNTAGINSRASDGYDTMDVEEPPLIGEYVQLSFTHSDWANSSGQYTSDFRSTLGTGKTWEFNVTTDITNKDVSITWPGITSVPKNCRFILEDLASGKRVYMRTRSSYTYNSGSMGGIRKFKLYAEPSDAGSLLISNVAVSQTRGSSVSINYTISRDAAVEVRVRDSNSNKIIRTLNGNTTRAAGINTATWDRSLSNGEQAPSGMYLAEIVATGPDGEVAKTIRPILVR